MARVPFSLCSFSRGWWLGRYLEDYEEPVEPVQPQRSLSSQLEASRGGGAKEPAKDPAECVAAFGALIDAAVEVAKKIQLRDRELAKLSNQVGSSFSRHTDIHSNLLLLYRHRHIIHMSYYST